MMKDGVRRAKKLRYRMKERADLDVAEDAEDEVDALGLPTNESTDNEHRKHHH